LYEKVCGPGPEAHVAVGRVHHADGQGELALRALDRAAAEDPGNVQAHFLAGLTYQKLLRRPRDAMAAYRRVVALRADHAAAHYHLGLVHLDQKEMRAAAEALERAVEARPGWDKASDRLLSVRLALGDFAAAEREARRRLDGAGEDAAAMISLAMALSSQLPERPTLLALLASLVSEDPRLAEALQWLERAVARGYRDVVTLEQNPHLRQVRDQAPLAFREILARATARARP
jgi:tetratricopeptide (TPR) repeat protein